ncbi:MAG TPA: hypothetical protein P5084_02445 [Paludibacter sp.]|nr:hypothetical protein [Paludibacter sp.]
MKKTLLLMSVILMSLMAQAQNVTGKWSGILQSKGQKYELVFHVSSIGEKLISTMDSPKQNFFGFKTTSTELKDSMLTISMKNANMEFQGKLLSDNRLVGIFTQLDQITFLELRNEKYAINKSKIEIPKKYHSYSYYIDTVQLGNNSRAIQSMPIKKGRTLAVILNCQTTDTNQIKMKSELVDHLTGNGFTVICIQSAVDMQSAIEYLYTLDIVNTKKISTLKMGEETFMLTRLDSKKCISKEIARTENKVKTMNLLTDWLIRG